MKKRTLITAIGSMSAENVLSHLKKAGHYVVGCDIYPGNWHYETKLCDNFYQAPFATSKDYIPFLIDLCKKEDIQFVLPLTDLEIDFLDRNRKVFTDNEIFLCMQTSEVLAVARNKFHLYETFRDDPEIPSVKTCLLSNPDKSISFPCIAKPYNGRSSEGLIRNATREQVLNISNKEDYILQEQISGDIFTVDYCRSSETGAECIVPRKELLRTKNGAGLTIQISTAPQLFHQTSHIGKKLDINGCVNMEYIFDRTNYFLIDINPRFSAGVAFSSMMGYDFVTNHIRCFIHEQIEPQIDLEEKIIVKKYKEEFT